MTLLNRDQAAQKIVGADLQRARKLGIKSVPIASSVPAVSW
jgi:hypothetical protein